MSAPDKDERPGRSARPPVKSQMVPTTEDKCNPQLEVEARIEAAASLAAYALLGELDEEVVLAAVVVLLDKAARFLAVADQEALLAEVTV